MKEVVSDKIMSQTSPSNSPSNSHGNISPNINEVRPKDKPAGSPHGSTASRNRPGSPNGTTRFVDSYETAKLGSPKIRSISPTNRWKVPEVGWIPHTITDTFPFLVRHNSSPCRIRPSAWSYYDDDQTALRHRDQLNKKLAKKSKRKRRTPGKSSTQVRE